MNLADPTQQLRNCSLCRQLDEAEIAALLGIVSTHALDKGAHLFWEGDEARGFYVLLDGGVRIYKSSPDGKEITLHHIRPGQMFAEAAIFSKGGYPAHCMATSDSAVAFFPKDKFIALITGSPQIALKMLAGLAGFVREFSRQVEDLSLHDVPARLARFLLGESERLSQSEFRLETTKAELARRLGTTSETLSRNLRRFSDLGAISVSNDRITILRNDLLETLVSAKEI